MRLGVRRTELGRSTERTSVLVWATPVLSSVAVIGLAATLWASQPDPSATQATTRTSHEGAPARTPATYTLAPILTSDNTDERAASRSRPATGEAASATQVTPEQIEFANDVAADDAIVLDTPPTTGKSMLFPVNAPVTSPFGFRLHPVLGTWRLHTGTDFGAPCGTPVVATRAGTVVSTGMVSGYGLRIVVDHGTVGGHSLKTAYNHLSVIGVRPGQQVEGGAGIARVGTTGMSTGCHLHFEVMLDGAYTDPMPFLDGLPSKAITKVPNVMVAGPSASPSPTVSTTPTRTATPATTSPPPATATPTPTQATETPTPTPTPTPSESASSSESASQSPTPSATESATGDPSPTP